MTSILVVDDHEVVRSGIKSILDPEDDLDVTGEAGSAMEAIRLAQ